MEMARRGQAVATIRSLAAEDRGLTPAVACDLPPRRLHQPLDREAKAIGGEPVDLGHLGAGKGRYGGPFRFHSGPLEILQLGEPFELEPE
jgi:hypothetical protein